MVPPFHKPLERSDVDAAYRQLPPRGAGEHREQPSQGLDITMDATWQLEPPAQGWFGDVYT